MQDQLERDFNSISTFFLTFCHRQITLHVFQFQYRIPNVYDTQLLCKTGEMNIVTCLL